MDEIKEHHAATLEWGCVTRLFNKIEDIEETMDGHWDALLDMMADIMTEEGSSKDPAYVFFYIYEFAFRLYYRLRANPEKRQFDIVRKSEKGFYIQNYDYKTFKWAKAGGFIMTISNDIIELPMDKLSTNQVRAFERRIIKE